MEAVSPAPAAPRQAVAGLRPAPALVPAATASLPPSPAEPPTAAACPLRRRRLGRPQQRRLTLPCSWQSHSRQRLQHRRHCPLRHRCNAAAACPLHHRKLSGLPICRERSHCSKQRRRIHSRTSTGKRSRGRLATASPHAKPSCLARSQGRPRTPLTRSTTCPTPRPARCLDGAAGQSPHASPAAPGLTDPPEADPAVPGRLPVRRLPRHDGGRRHGRSARRIPQAETLEGGEARACTACTV